MRCKYTHLFLQCNIYRIFFNKKAFFSAFFLKFKHACAVFEVFSLGIQLLCAACEFFACRSIALNSLVKLFYRHINHLDSRFLIVSRVFNLFNQGNTFVNVG